MNFVLSVDIGTTNIKAGVISESGNVLSYYEKELKIERPSIGAAEHNPDELYKSFLEVSRKVIKGFESRVSVLVLSTYNLGLIPLDNNMKPLMGIMTLLDERPKEIVNDLRKECNVNKLYERTGCLPLHQTQLFKIYWLQRKRKEIFRKTKYFLSCKDYIIYKLLKTPFTEPSLASATQLFNIHSKGWDNYALRIAGIKRTNLPEIVPSEKILAKLPLEACKSIGLKSDVYFLPGVYDGGGIALGIGGLANGLGAMNLGTTAMLRVCSKKLVLDKSGLMRFNPVYMFNDKWLIGGAINNAGLPLTWFKNNVFSVDYSSLISFAEKATRGSNGLFFLPFFTGERDSRISGLASASIFGLKSHHTKSDLILAALEGVAYSLRLIKESLIESNVGIKEIRIGGGGARSNLWVQIFSDCLGIPFRKAKNEKSSLIGSAMLAYVALGKYISIEEATKKMVRLSDTINPIKKNIQTYNKNFKLFLTLIEKYQ